jgi:hypothetical protein
VRLKVLADFEEIVSLKTEISYRNFGECPNFRDNMALYNAIDFYHKHPSFNSFLRIAKNVTPDMVRGGVRKDRCNIIQSDITDLALVYRGFKPMCMLYGKIPIRKSLLERLGFKTIQFSEYNPPSIYFGGGGWCKRFVIWKLEENYNKAIKFARHLMSYKYDLKTARQHEQIVGEALGYPQEDIDCFISHNYG